MSERSKPKTKYQGFALAVPLIDEIKEYIETDPQYRSVTDYVRQAVREKLGRDKRNPWAATINDPENKKLYDAEVWGNPDTPEDGIIKKVESRPQLEDRIKKVEEKLDTLIQVLSKDTKIS